MVTNLELQKELKELKETIINTNNISELKEILRVILTEVSSYGSLSMSISNELLKKL